MTPGDGDFDGPRQRVPDLHARLELPNDPVQPSRTGRLKNLSCGGYRLPTGSEWEAVAQAGTLRAKYTSEKYGPELDAIAWYSGNSGVSYSGGHDCPGRKEKQLGSTQCGTHPVALKRANSWGLHDMLGNVWEWGADGSIRDLRKSMVDPMGPELGSNRVTWGGSWSSLDGLGPRSHNAYDPGIRFSNLGFRLARTQVVAPGGLGGGAPPR